MHLYRYIDTVNAWKTFSLILSERSDIHMVNKISIVGIDKYMLKSFPVDAMVMPKYWFTNFIKMDSSSLKYRDTVILYFFSVCYTIII